MFREGFIGQCRMVKLERSFLLDIELQMVVSQRIPNLNEVNLILDLELCVFFLLDL
jgi:hypothetical protein